MAQFNATHEAAIDPERLDRARSALQRWEQRTSQVFNSQRGHDRAPYNGRPIIAIELTRLDTTTELITFEAYGLDISRSGLGLLLPGELLPVLANNTSQILRTENLLSIGREVTVGMLQNDGFRMWLATEVTLFKLTHEQLYQVAVKFCGRRAGLLV